MGSDLGCMGHAKRNTVSEMIRPCESWGFVFNYGHIPPVVCYDIRDIGM